MPTVASRNRDELPAGEVRVGSVGVGRGQVGHQADDVGRERRELPESVPAHARVELDVDGHVLRDPPVADDQLEPRLARLAHLARRAEDDDARSRQDPV